VPVRHPVWKGDDPASRGGRRDERRVLLGKAARVAALAVEAEEERAGWRDARESEEQRPVHSAERELAHWERAPQGLAARLLLAS